MDPYTYLKLGGSLLTEKKSAHTPRLDIIERCALEIKRGLDCIPGRMLILGHGSGSFGHVPAKKYQTRAGVHTPQEWQGFVEVWQEARMLNQLVVDACISAGLPVIAFPPSATILTRQGVVQSWNMEPLLAAVRQGMIPLVYGDVVFDSTLGGTILSTEDVFAELVKHLPPARILLAGAEKGVWQDFPKCTTLIKKIGFTTDDEITRFARGSDVPDVTGGMQEKLRILMGLVKQNPGCQGQIFSGIEPGSIEAALCGAQNGTTVALDQGDSEGG